MRLFNVGRKSADLARQGGYNIREADPSRFGPRGDAVKSILWVVMIVALAGWSASALGQNSAGSAAGTDQGKGIFTSRCAKCHDADASKKLPDGTTLLARLAKNKDPETRLATRLKSEQERHQVFLYLQPMIERERLSEATKNAQ